MDGRLSCLPIHLLLVLFLLLFLSPFLDLCFNSSLSHPTSCLPSLFIFLASFLSCCSRYSIRLSLPPRFIFYTPSFLHLPFHLRPPSSSPLPSSISFLLPTPYPSPPSSFPLPLPSLPFPSSALVPAIFPFSLVPPSSFAPSCPLPFHPSTFVPFATSPFLLPSLCPRSKLLLKDDGEAAGLHCSRRRRPPCNTSQCFN